MIITLTSDFGYKDSFVGIMKGVIAGINPQAQIIDLSHGIAPQDVMGAALLLRHSVKYFPTRDGSCRYRRSRRRQRAPSYIDRSRRKLFRRPG
jgi:hypothetical protein